MKISVNEVCKDMGISRQLFHSLANQGKLPFVLVNENQVNKTYLCNKERYELWKKGEL